MYLLLKCEQHIHDNLLHEDHEYDFSKNYWTPILKISISIQSNYQRYQHSLVRP